MQRRFLLPAAAAAIVLLSGCVLVPADGYDNYYDGPVVNVAPPAPRVEYYGPPPVVGNIWIGGYWHWGGNGHVWVPGYWSSPRPGYHWVPHAWSPYRGGGWREHRGHWGR